MEEVIYSILPLLRTILHDRLELQASLYLENVCNVVALEVMVLKSPLLVDEINQEVL